MTKHILVIDDEKAVLRGITRAFDNTPYEVETENSGREGLAKALAKSYDLIFLDINMPGLNGVEVFRKLREHLKDVPIFFITGQYEQFFDPLTKARKEGLDFFLLQKPFNAEKVLREAKKILEGIKNNDVADEQLWRFKLFVAGHNEKTQKTYDNVKKCLYDRFNGTHSFETIDLISEPEAAEKFNVFMTPTLLKIDPIPSRSAVGDLSSKERVFQWLDSLLG